MLFYRIFIDFTNTHNCTPLMTLPNMPIIARYSTLLKCLTTNSCPTLDTPYKVAPHRQRISPNNLLEPGKKKRNVHI